MEIQVNTEAVPYDWNREWIHNFTDPVYGVGTPAADLMKMVNRAGDGFIFSRTEWARRNWRRG